MGEDGRWELRCIRPEFWVEKTGHPGSRSKGTEARNGDNPRNFWYKLVMVPPSLDISLGTTAVAEAGADFAGSFSWGKVPYVNLSSGDYVKERSWGHIKP